LCESKTENLVNQIGNLASAGRLRDKLVQANKQIRAGGWWENNCPPLEAHWLVRVTYGFTAMLRYAITSQFEEMMAMIETREMREGERPGV
jgi:hypothetical protein